MVSSLDPENVAPITLDGIDSFEDLGSLITHTGQGANEIESRRGRARADFVRPGACLLRCSRISLRTKSGCEIHPMILHVVFFEVEADLNLKP